MPRVLLTTCCPQWPYARQTPASSGIWDEFEFVFNQSNVECDAWVVYDNPSLSLRSYCNPANTFFFSAEPPELKSYNRLFLNQFRWVVTCHEINHPGHIARQQSQPWHVGVDIDRGYVVTQDYDSLVQMQTPKKSRLISAAISDKSMTVGHRQRLEFVKQLKQTLGDRLSVLGSGHQPLADKWQAVAPFRFHLALENTSRPNYLTEKLGDAFLGNAFPFYYGAPNVADYYPPDSYETIDIFRPRESIVRICAAIDQDLDIQRADQVAQARRLVLDRWNLFPSLAKMLREKMVSGEKRPVCIYRKGQRIKLAMQELRRPFRRAA